MFTNRSRAMPSSAARCHRRMVVTSAPITPLTTNTAPSQTRSAHRASATKLGSPGVSIRLTLRSSQRTDDRLAEIDISRAFSSVAESETVVPSATEPSRLIAPAVNRSASLTEVFPLPRWPTKATLRILFGDACAMNLLPSKTRLCRLLPQRGPDGRVHLRDAVHLGQRQHAAERRGVGHDEAQLLAPPAEPARDVEDDLDAGRVEVAALAEVDHERQHVVGDGVQQLVADARGVGHVHLAAQPGDDGAALAVDRGVGERAHAACVPPSLLRILTIVPPFCLETSTWSIRPSMMLRPRPRCAPRRSRQCPRSVTVAVSSSESKLASTSKVASPGP